ncbi:glycosyltransferase [Salinisphaera sp. T31B1]
MCTLRRKLGRSLAFRSLERLGPRAASKHHGLSSKVVVSLTSYPARYDVLEKTLVSLLRQNVASDVIVLWLAEDDVASLPKRVRSLVSHGLQIRTCEDIKSYKKIVPSLSAYPGATIVTADDDIYYPPRWLECLVDEARRVPGQIVCHRAHRVLEDEHGLPLKYAAWNWSVAGGSRGRKLLPTSGAGVLYPGGCLDQRVTDRESFSALCPTADDLWLFWMSSVLNSVTVNVVQHPIMPMPWPGTGAGALAIVNNGQSTGNDVQIGRLLNRYGWL